jgi:hypothetical protein
MVHNRYDCHLLRIKPRLHSQSCQRGVIGGASVARNKKAACKARLF